MVFFSREKFAPKKHELGHGLDADLTEEELSAYIQLNPLWARWRSMHRHRRGLTDLWRKGQKSRTCGLDDGWMNFARWSMNNGYQPGKKLLRILPHIGFYPDNCIWVDDLEYKFFKLLVDKVLTEWRVEDKVAGRKTVKITPEQLRIGMARLEKYAKAKGVKKVSA